MLVIQSNQFNASRLNTVIAAFITSNTALAAMPGNVFVPAAVSGLPKDSVVNVPRERRQPRTAPRTRSLTAQQPPQRR